MFSCYVHIRLLIELILISIVLRVDSASSGTNANFTNNMKDKNDSIDSNKNQRSMSDGNEIPTFGEYREKWEKESKKQKREITNMKAYRATADKNIPHDTNQKAVSDNKAASIDSSSVQKDKIPSTEQSEKTVNSQNVNTIHTEQIQTDTISSDSWKGTEKVSENSDKLNNTTNSQPIFNQNSDNNAKSEEILTNDDSTYSNPSTNDNIKNSMNNKTNNENRMMPQIHHKQNMAAKECGAKILEQSPEIIQANSVLTNNNDEYMNMPCSANQKWLILETCEPVLIRSIQLANYEMFSSKFKTFKVFASDRYPVKHWHEVGIFRALDQKELQSFQVADTNMVKYIKFEFVDYYGSEHYCPLTFVRIYGNVVIDDEDEDIGAFSQQGETPNSSQTDQNEETVMNNEKKEDINPDSNILTKAKNIIKKMVTGISPKDGTAGNPNHDDDIANRKNIMRNLVASTSPCVYINFSSTFPSPAHLFHTFYNLLDSPLYLSDDLSQLPTPSILRYNISSILPYSELGPYDLSTLLASYHNLTIIYQQFGQPISQLYHHPHQSCHVCNKPITRCLFDEDENDQDFNWSKDDESESSITINHVNSIIKNMGDYNDNNQDGNNSTIQGDMNAHTADHIVIDKPDNATKNNNDSITQDESSWARNTTLVNEDKNSTNLNEAMNDFQVPREESGQSNLNAGVGNVDGNHGNNHGNQGINNNRQPLLPGSNAWNLAFMRIKNLARQLEHNVTLSMGYLDTLSQNYKAQTEKLRRLLVVATDNITYINQEVLQIRSDFQDQIKVVFHQLRTLQLMQYTSIPIVTNSTRPCSCFFLSLLCIVISIVTIVTVNVCVGLIMYRRLLQALPSYPHQLSREPDLNQSSYPLVLPPTDSRNLDTTPQSPNVHPLIPDKFYFVPSAIDCLHPDQTIQEIGPVAHSNNKKDKKMKKNKNRNKNQI